MSLTTVLVFVGAVLVISASPGPAIALILRRSALFGWRSTVPVVLGIEAGLYFWALAAGAGFAALVAASELAYLVLKVVGAVFLVFLGVMSLRAWWRMRQGTDVALEAPAEGVVRRTSARAGFLSGFVTNVANPKAAVFMVAFYPQFVPADMPLLATTAGLAAIQVLIEGSLYVGLAVVVASAGAWFRRPHVARRLEAVSGTVLVGLGLRVATIAKPIA
jgi:threonine/homoserine/homoserine lactone efflux protein